MEVARLLVGAKTGKMQVLQNDKADSCVDSGYVSLLELLRLCQIDLCEPTVRHE